MNDHSDRKTIMKTQKTQLTHKRSYSTITTKTRLFIHAQLYFFNQDFKFQRCAFENEKTENSQGKMTFLAKHNGMMRRIDTKIQKLLKF